MNRFLPTLFAALVLANLGTMVRAQDSVLAELYGQGVHAYFSGNLRQAHEMLTSAIEQGSRDPRAYYYRGLTYHRLGRPDEANADLKRGAVLEATSTDRIYPVADSLQRVQGSLRVQIENQRRMARLAVKIRQNQIEQARYQQTQQGDAAAARPAAPPTRGPAPAVVPAAPPAADPGDPFAAGAQVTPEKAPAKPAPAAAPPAADEDPFGAVTPSNGTSPAATPGTPAPATPAPAPAEADPFSPAAPATPEPAKDDASTDPFSDDQSSGTMPAETPTDKPAEKPADDPFGF